MIFKRRKQLVPFLTAVAFLLLQAILEYLLFVVLIISDWDMAAWFGERANLNYALKVSFVAGIFMVFFAIWFAKKFYREK